VRWLSWGADLRWRHEFYDYAATLGAPAASHEANYQRYRARFWATWFPAEALSLNTRLSSESRLYFTPRTAKTIDLDEWVVDNLNLRWECRADNPMVLVLGRQDIQFGNRWLIRDGTTRDASRTEYFEAARLTLDWRKNRTVVDLIGFNLQANPRFGVPVINSHHRDLREEDSRGLILHLANRSLAATRLDGYFICRHDRPARANGNQGDLFLWGGRMERDLNRHWRLRLEGAWEAGRKNGRELRAFGVNNLLVYQFNDARQNELRLAHEHLSGDDPNTPRDEGFDPFWGRRATFSELLVYTFAAENRGRSAEWTNLERLGAGWSFRPAPKLEWLLDYHALFARENPLAGTPGYSARGAFRGHLLAGVLKASFSDHLTGHLWAELFSPGDYYAPPKNRQATFLRAQLQWVF